jgi:hypothetical protein
MDPGLDRVLGLAPAVQEDPDLVGLADPVALGRLAPVVPEVRAVQDLVRRVDRVELTDPAAPRRAAPRLVDPRLVDPAVPVELRPVVPVELTDPAAPRRAAPRLVDLRPVALVALVVLTDPVALAGLHPVALVVPMDTGPVGPAGLVVPMDTGLVDLVDLVGRVDLVDLVAPDLMDPVGRAAPVDHRRRLMSSMAPSIAVARNSAVRETRRTASAHPIMVLRHRPRSTGSVGTAGRLPVVLRRTGTGRLLPVAGTVRRLPVVGTRGGTVRAAI